MRIILASSSPRRVEILKKIGLNFDVIPSRVIEHLEKGDFGEMVENLAMEKAKEVFNRTFDERLVIGADTVVVFNDEVLGKPRDFEEAERFLKRLSGKTHKVYTGVAFVWNNGEYSFHEKTVVKFRNLPDELVKKYVSSGSPMDKAGGYGIQDLGSVFVEKVDGDFYNVMGLPIGKVWEFLYKKGWWK